MSKASAHLDEIIRLIEGGSSREEACNAVGIDAKTLWRFLSHNPSAKSRLQAARRARERSANARQITNQLYSPEDYDRALAAMRAHLHRDLKDIFSVDPTLPTLASLKYRASVNSAFAAKLEAVRAERNRVTRHRSGNVEAGRAALLENELYAAAASAVPRRISHPDLRNEIVSMIVIGLLDGTISNEELRSDADRIVSGFLKSFLRQSGYYHFRSIDHGEVLTETLTADEFTFEGCA